MTASIKALPTRKAECSERARSIIDGLVALADDKGVEAVAVAVVHPDGCVTTSHTTGDSFYQIIGALEDLKVDIFKERDLDE